MLELHLNMTQNFHKLAFYHLKNFLSFFRVTPDFVPGCSYLRSFCLTLGWSSKWFRKSLGQNGKIVKYNGCVKRDKRAHLVKIKGRKILPNWLFGHDCSCHCWRCWIPASIDISGESYYQIRFKKEILMGFQNAMSQFRRSF